MKYLSFLTAAFLTLVTPAFSSVDYFMYFPGTDLEGSTQDEDFKEKKATEVISLSFGIENIVNIGSIADGGGAGKTTFNALEILAAIDPKIVPAMMQKLVTGDHFNDIVIEARQSGGGEDSKGITIMKLELKLALVEGFYLEGTDGEDRALYNMNLQFGAFKLTTTSIKLDGTAGDEKTVEWSRVLNQANFAVE